MKTKFTTKARFFGMKFALVLFTLLLISGHGWGQQLLYEDFNYATPAYIGGNAAAGSTSNNWTTHSVTTGQTTTIDIQNGSLSYTGLASSNGNKVYLFGNANATSRDVNRVFTTPTSATTLYYSALISIIDNTQITTNGDYFLHFGATSGSTVTTFGGRLGAKSVNTGTNFRFIIQNTSGGTPTFTDNGTDMTFGTTYLVVVKYDRSAIPTVATMWINPTSLGGSEPLTGFVSNNSGTSSVTALASICLRNNATTPKANIDEIRVGTTWADITPLGGLSTPPSLTADASNNNVDNNIDITFTDNATWRGLVSAVKINGTSLTPTTDYVLTSGNLQLKPSSLNILLSAAGSKAVTIEAAGYSAASVTQIIDAGAATKLGMKTQPSAPAGNGGTLATQPAVYIQDQYGNTTSSIANVVAAVGSGVWTLGGTTSVAGISGTVTYSGLTATSASAVTGATINFTSGTLTGITSGTFNIPAPAPTVVITPTTLTGFTYSEGAGPSLTKTFTVSGLNLTDNITISASTNYEISLSSGTGYTTPITLTQSGGTVSTTTIYVRLKAGLVMGSYNGEVINITSTGSTPATVTCSGDVTAPQATLPLYENFSYVAVTDLTANGWIITGTNVSPTVSVSTPTITYPGYLSSGIGNEVSLASSGQDVNRSFVPQITGSVYCSFLVNVTSANTTGDYFFHLGPNPIGTTFKAKVFVKKDASNNLFFGVSQQSNTPVYSTTAYALGTTYLVVLKYTIVTGTNNDIASIFINPVLNAVEPTSGWLVNTDAPTDPTDIGSIALRQGSATNAATLKLDGIRVSTVWSDIVGTAISTPTVTVNPTTLTGFTYVQGTGPSSEQSFTVSGQNLTGNISIAPAADYEISTITGAGFSPTNPIVLTQTAGSVSSTLIYVRLKSGLTAASYNGEVITASTSGTTDVTVTCDGSVTIPGPIISVTPVSLGGFSSILGSYSTSQTYTVSGDYLNADLTVTAPANFEVSTDDISYSPSVLLAQSGGNIIGEPKTVYIRIAASASAGVVTGNIVHSSTGLSPVNLLLSGNVYYPEPINHASDFVATSPIYTSVTITWADNDGAQPATGFMIIGNTTGVFTPPVDGVSQNNDYNLADGSGVAHILHGVQTFTWTGLVSSTHYYFTIYPYTNSGVNIDYKLTPAAPTADIITQVYASPLAAWTFDILPATDTTPTSVAANIGIQAATAMLYANGTNGSSLWLPTISNTELNSLGGTTINDPREGLNVIAGKAYSPIAGGSLSANGKSMVIKFSMTNYKDPILTFAVRGTATGFNTHQWAWSTDNITYTNFGANTADNSATYLTRTLDMSSIDQLDQAADVYLRVTFNGATNTSGNNRIDNIVIRASEVPQTKTLNAKLFLEGLFNSGSGMMSQAYGLTGPQFGAGIADQVTVELHNSVSPYTLAYAYNDVNLNTDGSLSINTIPAVVSDSYYIVIKHRNSIETWSKLPVNFGVTGPITYDFTTAASQAFDDNMKLEGTVYAIFGGNPAQDVAVDASDLAVVDNAVTAVLKGYNSEDVNGDGIVDASDLALIDNNVTAIVQTKKP